MKVVLFGATGMVGQGVLRECLLDPDVESVLAVVRNASLPQHDKLREIVHQDVSDLAAIEDTTPNPVVTSLAGFSLFAFAFSLVERFSGLGLVLGLAVLSTRPASDPVVTSLAGFAGARRPHPPGGRTPTPAAFR